MALRAASVTPVGREEDRAADMTERHAQRILVKEDVRHLGQGFIKSHGVVLLVRIAPSASIWTRKTDVVSLVPVTAKTSLSTARSDVISPWAARIASSRVL